MPENSNLKPVAFMVMPFGQRTIPSPPIGAPARIDCNALWDHAFRPVLMNLGYLAVRAGALIKERNQLVLNCYGRSSYSSSSYMDSNLSALMQ
jgi:hypothetical protein